MCLGVRYGAGGGDDGGVGVMEMWCEGDGGVMGNVLTLVSQHTRTTGRVRLRPRPEAGDAGRHAVLNSWCVCTEGVTEQGKQSKQETTTNFTNPSRSAVVARCIAEVHRILPLSPHIMHRFQAIKRSADEIR